MKPNTDVYDKIHRLYPKAHEATKATQETKGSTSRFRTRLKSVNHLSHEGSKIVNQPLARIAEALLEVWIRIKNAWSGLMKRLYPRKHVIYGTNMDSSLVGQLTFSHRDDAHIPIHHMRLEFWARTKLGKWKLISMGFTEEDGTFELPFDMMAVHGYDIRKLWFEMYHTDTFKFEGHRAKPVHELWHKFKVKKGDLTGMSYDLGMIQLDYWEYRTDTPLPRVCINDHDHEAPEQYAPGRVDAIEKQFIPIELTTKKHLIEIDAGSNLTLDKIQAAYPENLTVCMENESPGITRTDEWFGIRFMNGMFASTFDLDPDDPSLYWVYYHWRTYADTNSIYAMPDVSIKFKMQDNGYLIPVEISLKGKLREAGDPNEKVTLTPSDGEKWESAKRVARVSGAIATEVDRHFAETHTNVEQMEIAARRNVRRNPIGGMLFPHLKEVSLINHTADQILINDTGYIAQATALKKDGLRRRVYDVMGTIDWKGWVPMEPISDKHIYARAAKLFHEITTRYVDEFIELHKQEIIDEWHEVYSMSNDLVKHSVPVFMCSYIRSKLKPDSNDMVAPSPDNAWFTRSNRMDLNVERTDFTVDEALERGWIRTLVSHEDENKPSGIKRAFSPITTSPHYKDGSGDLERLKSYCAYSIFQATFGHYWSNSKQYDDIGEIKYSSLGIRLGTPENGILGPEDDTAISPDLKISTQMMWWSNMLSRTGYGFLTKNEEGDISPRFIELLEEQREAFAELDLDIDDIQSRTNI